MQQNDSNPESLILCNSYGPNARLTVSRHHMFGRLPLEKKPDRIHQAKAAISIARQVARRATNTPDEVLFFGSGLTDESNSIRHLMPEMKRIRVLPAIISSMFDSLLGLRSATSIVVVGESAAPKDETVIALANFLDGLDADIRRTVLTSVLESLEKSDGNQRNSDTQLVIQERPGKFSMLQLPDEVATKSAARRIQGELSNLQSEKDYVARVSAENGWAAGGITVEDLDPKNPKAINIAAASFQWLGDPLSLEMHAKTAESIISWFRDSLEQNPAEIRQISFSGQSVSVSGKIVMELGRACGTKRPPTHQFPEFALGWMPVASILMGLVDATPPALYVCCERFPDVEVLAIWR